MKSRKIISLILVLCVIISVLALSVFSAAADDSSDRSGSLKPADYRKPDGSLIPPISYGELSPGNRVKYLNGDHVSMYAGQDENATDIIIHDSNEIDGPRVSDKDYNELSAYIRIIDDYPYYPGDPGNGGMMVSRIRKPSATPDEVTSDDDESEHPTSEEPAESGKEKAAADSSSKSPKTGYTLEVAMLIILMFFAVIGIGVSVCSILKKRG